MWFTEIIKKTTCKLVTASVHSTVEIIVDLSLKHSNKLSVQGFAESLQQVRNIVCVAV